MLEVANDFVPAELIKEKSNEKSMLSDEARTELEKQSSNIAR